LNIYVIDESLFSNIAKLKKRTKTAQALPQQGFGPFFHTTTPIPVKEHLSICVCNYFGGGGERGMGDNCLFCSQ
jgi:hypothetical protein